MPVARRPIHALVLARTIFAPDAFGATLSTCTASPRRRWCWPSRFQRSGSSIRSSRFFAAMDRGTGRWTTSRPCSSFKSPPSQPYSCGDSAAHFVAARCDSSRPRGHSGSCWSSRTHGGATAWSFWTTRNRRSRFCSKPSRVLGSCSSSAAGSFVGSFLDRRGRGTASQRIPATARWRSRARKYLDSMAVPAWPVCWAISGSAFPASTAAGRSS
jgi:hypothetical protein